MSETTHHRIKTLPLWKKIMYALGQLGWSLGSYSALNLINYFYVPAEGKQGPGFPAFISQQLFFGVTIIGMIVFGTRIWDAILDPVVAAWSDRSTYRFGRRMPFMAVGTLGLALFSFLIFLPPQIGESWVNSLWLTVMVSLFYFFLTVYTMPYAALLSEMAHTPEERLNLATLNSITWALGFAVGNQVYLFKGLLEPQMLNLGFSPELAPLRAFQFTLGIFAVFSALMMALPVIFIREHEYCKPHVSHMGTWECVIATLRNRSFRFFVCSDFAYWVAMTIIQSTIAYYVTLLIGLPEGETSNMLLVMFITSFLFYIPINIFAKKFGQKKILIFAFVVFSLVFASVFFLGSALPLSPLGQGYGIAILSALPIAIFGILPNSLIADIADADGFKTGEYRAGMFFATRTLGMKLGTAVATLIIPSLLVFGKSPENSIGVRLTGVVAFAFCVLGLLLLLKVDEASVLKTIAEEDVVEQEGIDPSI